MGYAIVCTLFHRIAVCYDESPTATRWKCRHVGCGRSWATAVAPEPPPPGLWWFGRKPFRP